MRDDVLEPIDRAGAQRLDLGISLTFGVYEEMRDLVLRIRMDLFMDMRRSGRLIERLGVIDMSLDICPMFPPV